MAGLLTAFITGVATQANANIAENLKYERERDLRREQEADQLANWMKQTDYQASIQQQQDEERAKREFEIAKRKFSEIELPGYREQKRIDLETSKQLKAYENALDLSKESAKASYQAQADQESFNKAQGLIQSIYPELGPITGGLGSTQKVPDKETLAAVDGPRISELPKIQQALPEQEPGIPPQRTISDLYKLKELGGVLEATKSTSQIGKAVKDIADAKIASATDQNKWLGAVEYADKGDPFKEIEAYVKALGGGSPLAESPLFNPKALGTEVPTVNSIQHRQSLLDANKLAQVAGDLTRIEDVARGVPTNISRLTSGQNARASLDIIIARNTLLSPSATLEQKKEAALQIDTSLRSLDITRDQLARDKRLSSVFTKDVKTEFNKAIGESPEIVKEKVKTFSIRDPRTGKTGIAEGTREEIEASGYIIIGQ